MEGYLAVTIQQYLCALFVNLFIVVGVWKIFQKDMICGGIGDWLYRRIGEWYSKPLFNCPPCMGSVYGVAFFWLSDLHNHLPWWSFPLHAIALCGVTAIAMMLDNHE